MRSPASACHTTPVTHCMRHTLHQLCCSVVEQHTFKQCDLLNKGIPQRATPLRRLLGICILSAECWHAGLAVTRALLGYACICAAPRTARLLLLLLLSGRGL